MKGRGLGFMRVTSPIVVRESYDYPFGGPQTAGKRGKTACVCLNACCRWEWEL